MHKYNLGKPRDADNIFSCRLPKNTSLSIFNKIPFDIIDVHSSLNKKKHISENIDLILSSIPPMACISLTHIKASDVAEVKKLLQKTKKEWLSRVYENYDMSSHILALKILTDKTAVLLYLDMQNEGIDEPGLVGTAYQVEDYFQRLSIKSISWAWDYFLESEEPQIFNFLNSLDTPYFKDLMTKQIEDDEIIKQKLTLNKAISKKKKSQDFAPQPLIHKV